MIDKLEAGATVDDLIDEYGFNRSGIRYIVGERYPEFRNRDLLEDFDNGMPLLELAGKYDIKKKTIIQILYDHDRTLGGPSKVDLLTEEVKFQIMLDYNKGQPVEELIEKYDINKDTLYKITGLCRRRRSSKPSKAEKLMIAKRYLINEMTMKEATKFSNLTGNSGNKYRFVDPILNPEFFEKYNYGYMDVKKRFKFNSKYSLKDHWKAWILCNEKDMSCQKVEDRTNLDLNFVYAASRIRTASAFVAVWELAKKRGLKVCQG